jgi:uncharacterized membrane protein
MTQTVAPTPLDEARFHHRPATDAQALRDIHTEVHDLHDKVQEIKQYPAEHHPKLVLSEHVRGSSILDKIADGVNVFCGSMYVFLFITVGIVAWLILGPVIGFDKVPWPLLLTLLNLPQLSIMVSLQVSANRAQAASDKRAIADHETLIALHTMAGQQIDILHKQDAVLGILQQFASHDMPGRQEDIQQTVNEILTAVRGPAGDSPAAGAVPAT